MLHVTSASRITTLSAQLTDVLVEPLDDPMQPEWIAAPTLGMHRWLALELAKRLGNSTAGRADGVAANITFMLPGALRQIALAADRPEDESNPWEIRHLVWTVLSVLHSAGSDEALAPLTRIPDGSTWFGKARRIADLFDRYDLHRPELILHWAHGHDVDGLGQRLGAHMLWQPRLWRAIRSAIGTPSSAERLPELIAGLRDGSIAVDLPPRLFIFGLTTLPGGVPFIDLLTALAAQREVHLMMLDPSPAASEEVRRSGARHDPDRPLFRAEDSSELAIRHPLLRSWGRPYRERTALLASLDVQTENIDDRSPLAEPTTGSDASLLRAIQADLLEDRAPSQDFDLKFGDHSVEIHSTYGEARQTDALRDAILRRLDADPTLREDDIVVLSPALERFAPHIEASFGPSAEQSSTQVGDATPRLRYRITDRSLRTVSPLIEAFDALLSLLAGRAGATGILEFISLAPVRERFIFSDDDVATIRSWVLSAGTKWGFDVEHREKWGLPASAASNTWRQLIDRLMYGIAISEGGFELGVGEVSPLQVEGSDIGVAGALAQLIYRLRDLESSTTIRHSPAAWAQLLSDAASDLFATAPDDAYQFDQLRQVFAALGTDALNESANSAIDLSLAEVRQAIASSLEGNPGRANFFRGGITISSLTPLRWLPFRVVCLLGLDEALLSGGALESDDLVALAPMLGDRDPRAELRQSLLEAVIAAGNHLVITHSGHSIVTNQRVPDAVALTEFTEVLESTVSSEKRGLILSQVVITHPRQADDDRYFLPNGLQGGVERWSYDHDALQGARARLSRREVEAPFLARPLDSSDTSASIIALGDLHEFLRHPVRAFLRRRLQVHLAFDDPELNDELDIEISPLKYWELGESLLRARLSGVSSGIWERHERSRGSLPVGEFAAPIVAELDATVDQLLDHVAMLRLDATELTRYPIDILLPDGSRIVGVVPGRCGPDRPGPGVITFSRFSSALHLRAWLNLAALEANDPSSAWRSVLVSRGESDKLTPRVLELTGSQVADEERRRLAVEALEVVVDCYRRGMSEPLPLFSRLSPRIAERKATAKDWKDTSFNDGPPRNINDGYERANFKAFGDLTYDELCDIPALATDPGGASQKRVERYADYLFGAVAASGIRAGEAEGQ